MKPFELKNPVVRQHLKSFWQQDSWNPWPVTRLDFSSTAQCLGIDLNEAQKANSQVPKS
jgi:hypothetical protein